MDAARISGNLVNEPGLAGLLARPARMAAYRFMCRKRGEAGWEVYFALTGYHTAQSAARMVADWNRKDRGRDIEWRTEECLPGSVDHPTRR